MKGVRTHVRTRACCRLCRRACAVISSRRLFGAPSCDVSFVCEFASSNLLNCASKYRVAHTDVSTLNLCGSPDAYAGSNTTLRDTINNLVEKQPQTWHTTIGLPFRRYVQHFASLLPATTTTNLSHIWWVVVFCASLYTGSRGRSWSGTKLLSTSVFCSVCLMKASRA